MPPKRIQGAIAYAVVYGDDGTGARLASYRLFQEQSFAREVCQRMNRATNTERVYVAAVVIAPEAPPGALDGDTQDDYEEIS